jgi:hypothetical protein
MISIYSHIQHKKLMKRKSAELNLVTAQSTAYKPPEDGQMSGPKHVGLTSLKAFLTVF